MRNKRVINIMLYVQLGLLVRSGNKGIEREEYTMTLKNNYFTVENLLSKYELSTETIQVDLKQMENFKVTSPIIGGFSTGKTSMINAFLDKKLLRTNITAETAVPTEISYGKEHAIAIKNNEETVISFADLLEKEFTVDDTDCIKITIPNENLKLYSTVEIVDMPGFDSGIQAHNRAIDQYIHKSLAYILTFAADEPVVKESVADFLKELSLFDVPVYVCVTKADKVSEEVLHENVKAIERSILQLLGVAPRKTVTIWSKRNRNTDGLNEILSDIEKNSRMIFETKFSKQLKKHAKTLEQYLEERLKGASLTVSEIDEKEDKIQREIEYIQTKIEREQQRFEKQLESGIQSIQGRVDRELGANHDLLVSQLIRGGDIQSKLNLIVRTAVTAGLKEEFEPKLQQHLQNLTKAIELDIPLDATVQVDQFKVQTDQMVKEIAMKSLPLLLGAIGVVLTGPLGGLILGVATLVADLLFQKKRENDLRQEAEQKLTSEIIPLVVRESEILVGQELHNYTASVHDMIQQEVGNQRDVLQKALQDLRVQKEKEQLNHEQLKVQLTEDLQQVKEVLYDAASTV